MKQGDLFGDTPAYEAPSRALARNTDPDTAHAAAASVNVSLMESIVLAALAKVFPGGLTTEELAEATGYRRDSISPRLRPLEAKGKVVRIGKRLTSSGRQAIVWALPKKAQP